MRGGVWTCASIRPGTAKQPSQSGAGSSGARGRTATMRPSRSTMLWSSSRPRPGFSTVTPETTRVSRAGVGRAGGSSARSPSQPAPASAAVTATTLRHISVPLRRETHRAGCGSAGREPAPGSGRPAAPARSHARAPSPASPGTAGSCRAGTRAGAPPPPGRATPRAAGSHRRRRAPRARRPQPTSGWFAAASQSSRTALNSGAPERTPHELDQGFDARLALGKVRERAQHGLPEPRVDDLECGAEQALAGAVVVEEGTVRDPRPRADRERGGPRVAVLDEALEGRVDQASTRLRGAFGLGASGTGTGRGGGGHATRLPSI